MLFRRLDRYLALNFVQPFLLSLFVILGLYMVGDAFSNLNEYLREAQGFFLALARMAYLYVLRAPAFLVTVFPVAMLFGAAYGISQLSARNEIMAMKAAGVSFFRILTPIYAMAVLAGALAFANNEMVVPSIEGAASRNLRIWKGQGDRSDRVISDVAEENIPVYQMFYNPVTRRATSLSVIIEPPGGPVSHFYARSAEPIKGGWKLYDVTGSGAPEDGIWKTRLRPKQVELELLPPAARPMQTLEKSIAEAKKRQNHDDVRSYTFYYYDRLAYPFTGLVLVALGLPFVIGHERIQRSRMLGIGVCVGICLVFYAVQFIARDLGLHKNLPPSLAAWLPNIIFGGLALYMLESVHE